MMNRCFTGYVRWGLLLRLLIAVVATSLASPVQAAELRITSTPNGASIFVNGKATKGVTPAAVELSVGDKVRLELDGHEPFAQEIQSLDDRVNPRLDEVTAFRMFLDVKTANRKNAGTDDLSVVILLNGDPSQRRVLNRPRYDARRVGAIDHFQFDFDCPTQQLKGIQVRVEGGADAWKCEGMVIRMEKGDALTSRTYNKVINKWMSADAKEGVSWIDIPLAGVRFRPFRIPEKPFRVTVSGRQTQANPARIGRVSVGDRVTIAPVSGTWSIGGARAGKFCDWRGYEGGQAVMALHIAVGDKRTAVTDREFTFRVEDAGLLALYANDKDPRGNTGSLVVMVTVDRASP